MNWLAAAKTSTLLPMPDMMFATLLRLVRFRVTYSKAGSCSLSTQDMQSTGHESIDAYIDSCSSSVKGCEARLVLPGTLDVARSPESSPENRKSCVFHHRLDHVGSKDQAYPIGS